MQLMSDRPVAKTQNSHGLVVSKIWSLYFFITRDKVHKDLRMYDYLYMSQEKRWSYFLWEVLRILISKTD